MIVFLGSSICIKCKRRRSGQENSYFGGIRSFGINERIERYTCQIKRLCIAFFKEIVYAYLQISRFGVVTLYIA